MLEQCVVFAIVSVNNLKGVKDKISADQLCKYRLKSPHKTQSNIILIFNPQHSYSTLNTHIQT